MFFAVLREVRLDRDGLVWVRVHVGYNGVIVRGLDFEDGDVHNINLPVMEGVVEVPFDDADVCAGVGQISGLHRLQALRVIGDHEGVLFVADVHCLDF